MKEKSFEIKLLKKLNFLNLICLTSICSYFLKKTRVLSEGPMKKK